MGGFWHMIMTLRLPTGQTQYTYIYTRTRTLTWTHLTLLQTRGWHIFSPLTGSIKGQSAAQPHAARQQRDTADYRVTARRTMDGGCVFGERELQWEGDRRWEKRWAGQASKGLYLDFPFGTKLLPVLSKWDINAFVCLDDKLFAVRWQVQYWGDVWVQVQRKHWSVTVLYPCLSHMSEFPVLSVPPQ